MDHLSVTSGAAQSLAFLTTSVAASLFGVGLTDISAPTRRTEPVAHARQLAIYLAHVGFGQPAALVAGCFHRHRTTVRHSCARIEDRRDDAAFDRALDVLEAAVRGYAVTFLPLTEIAGGHS